LKKDHRILQSKKYHNIFLHTKAHFTTDEKVNIILSPEFYWVRIFQLPLKSIKEVNKVLPSLFDEFTDTLDLSYYSKKLEDGKFLCFAYNHKRILDQMKDSNIASSQVHNIYFAQLELSETITNADSNIIKVDDIFFTLSDEIVVQVPQSLVPQQEIQSIDVSTISLSKNKIYFNAGSKYIDRKTFISSSIILVLLSVFTIAKIVSTNYEKGKYTEARQVLQEQYKLPPSMIQTRSIVSQFQSIKQEQLKLRQAVEYIYAFNLKNSRIVSVKLKDNIFEVKLDQNDINYKRYLEKKYKLDLAEFRNEILSIRFKV
jgi:hypothetical protein